MELQLNPLSDDEIRELIINTCGLDPPDGLVDSVASVSEGSPFFAHNAIQLLGSKGLLTEQSFAQNDDWQVDIPSVVKDVIASRIADLSKPCANMLQQAAVIGREFDFAVLVGLLGEPDVNDLRELLTEAKNAKVINDSGDSSVRFVFDHDLFRQALEVEIHPDVRAGLHLRIAELMDDLFGDSDVEYSGRIAYHYLQAVSVSPSDVVAMACNRAGRVANKAHAYTDGETHFSVAINLLEDSIELRPILAESLEGYARSLAAQGRVSESFDPLRRAFEIYLGEGITERALEISAVSIPHYSRTGATAMLEQAVELSQDDTEAQSLLLSRLGAARAFELQDFDGAEQAHQASLRAARAAKSPFAEAWAYGRAAMVQAPDWEQVESLARKSLEAMPRESNLEIEVHSRIFLAGAFYHRGDITAARTELVRANEIAIQTRNPMRAEQTANELAMLLKLEGRWDECLERQVPVGYQINARPFGPHMVRAQIFYAIGQLDRATAAYSKVRDMMSSSRLSLDLHVPEPGREYGFWQMDIAGLLGITGDTSFLNDVPASELWDELPSDATVLSVSRRPALLLRTWVTGAIAIARDDSATARKVLELVRQYRYPVNNHKTNFGGSHDRLKGRLAATAGLSEEAIGHFEIARQFCSENGLAYDHGWSCHDLALTLVENPKNVARVRSLIKEGQKVADDYGIKPLSDQLAKLETRLSDEASDAPFGLTAREVEILRCLADELTYKQIAERLVVSQNTVGTHVKNIYSKTGSSRRAEALRAAVESGLLSYDE
jgi:DNA-binding CsgD family transcriptional regulator